MEEMRNAYNNLVGKHEGMSPFGIPRRRWEDNIKMDLRETGWEGVNCMRMDQDRYQCLALLNTVMNIRVPQKEGNF
jgi:hypothetical protein